MSGAAGSLKHNRILDLCMRMIEGEVINKKTEAENYGVAEKSIQRDIDDLKAFFYERGIKEGMYQEIIYDRKMNGYYLHYENSKQMKNSEVFAVSKILLESRAFNKEELSQILDKLIFNCVPKKDKRKVEELIANEKFYYIELSHKQSLIDKIWDIALCIREQRKLEIEYIRSDGKTVRRVVHPAGVMFSEFYFYMPAFIEKIDKEAEFENPDDTFPTIYRIDRIGSYKITDEHFRVIYSNRFSEGEFRKRVQFMYGGRLKTVRFEYSGGSVEAVLDRLPTAKIEKFENGIYTVRAEVFGKGIDMWLKMQGDCVKVLNQ